MIATLLAVALTAPPTAGFEPKDGDRIVWIGNTLVEREQRYGHWEAALLAAFPERNVTVRNLGWSGDTVHGDARAGFDTPAKGFERLVSLTHELKPTVIFVSYGTNESFESEAGLPRFEKGLNKLLDALKPTGARIVLFTPLPFQNPETKHAGNLQTYSDTIRVVAAKRSLSLADLAGQLPQGFPASYTDNGMHLTGNGYGFLTDAFLASLGIKPTLPPHPLVTLASQVAAKNQLFFYKWRPQNETYLFGFRKHEQGKNAKEIAEFDPLIAAAEKDIRQTLNKLNTKK